MARAKEPTTLLCPYCKKPGGVEYFGRPARGHHTPFVVVHKYHCPCGKDFTTEERGPNVLANVYINGAPFSGEDLANSLWRVAPKRLTIVERRAVAAAAAHGLVKQIDEKRIPQASFNDDGAVHLDGSFVAARTLDALAEVATQQRDLVRVEEVWAAHVQYALATGSGKWRQASDFLRWYSQQPYAQVARTAVPESRVARQQVEWWVPPALPRTDIAVVVKNQFVTHGEAHTLASASVGRDEVVASETKKATRRRVSEPFLPEKLRGAIRRAVAHRPAEVDAVEYYVRWALDGQTIVRSSQLSTLVSETLRSVDDIAYLRWVMCGKELTASTVFEEACGLVSSPSPRLCFRREDARILRTSHGGVRESVATAGPDSSASAEE